LAFQLGTIQFGLANPMQSNPFFKRINIPNKRERLVGKAALLLSGGLPKA